MLTSEELNREIAACVRTERTKAGLSKLKLASLIGVNDKTVGNWEDGRSVPTFSQLLDVFNALGVDLIPHLLRIMYPHTFGDRQALIDKRNAIAQYFLASAPELFVEQAHYLLFEEHGSHFGSQLQAMVAIDHLPLEARLLVLIQVLYLFEMNCRRNALTNPDAIMPDFELLQKAQQEAEKAVNVGRQHYTVTVK